LRTGPALASPDLLLLHPDTWANIRTQKDTLGLQAAPRVVRCPGRGPPSVGQGVRRCGHVARSAPDVARGGHGMSPRRTLPGAQRHPPGTTLALRYSTKANR
jgi:hypothetical protein